MQIHATHTVLTTSHSKYCDAFALVCGGAVCQLEELTQRSVRKRELSPRRGGRSIDSSKIQWNCCICIDRGTEQVDVQYI